MKIATSAKQPKIWLLATVLAAFPTIAAAQPRLPARGVLFERAMERLELSSDQREQVREILAEHRDDLRQEVDSVRALREAVLRAARDLPFDEARVRAAVQAVAAAQAELAVSRARVASQVRAVLSVEQRERLDGMLETVRALAGRLRERRGARWR